MTRLGLLVHPSANRVYADASVALTEAELAIVGDRVLGGRLERGRHRDHRRRPLRHLRRGRPGRPRPRPPGQRVDRLRPVRAARARCSGRCELRRLDRYDDDLLTVLKYAGKTNETFTKLLLNATLLAASSPGRMLDERLRVLDPMCGRGTTVNQALMYGYDAAGRRPGPQGLRRLRRVPRDLAPAQAAQAPASTSTRSGTPASEPARRLEGDVRRRQGGLRPRATGSRSTWCTPTRVRCGEFFKAGSFDVVVTDAPYGVQHGSRSAGAGWLARTAGPAGRGRCPGWVRLLRPGGALGHRLEHPRRQPRAARRGARPAPGSRSSTTRRTCGCGTGSTRRSCVTSLSRAVPVTDPDPIGHVG